MILQSFTQCHFVKSTNIPKNGGKNWLLNPKPKIQKPDPSWLHIWSCFIDQIEDQENNAEQSNDPQIVDNETKPNNEDLNEALRTAKKIAKALVSGLVRQGPQE